MDAMDLLLGRASVSALTTPAPDHQALAKIFASAVRAPDHGRLRPWHFLVIPAERRAAFGEILAASLARRDPEASAAMRQRERDKAMRAPMIIVTAARLQPAHKVPVIEQRASAAAAVQNILLATHALGFGVVWKTGAAAYDDGVRAALGLGEHDEITGFLYLGTPAGPPAPAPRPTPCDHFAVWQG